jgi:hypothetical protein
MSTKCIAFSNNDVILVAWTFAHKLEDCVGCDVRRIPAESANIHSDEPQGESLPAMAVFPGDPNAGKKRRTTAQGPIQKLFWKDLFVTDLASPGPYIYQVIPLKGTFDDKGVPTLIPYPDVHPLFSNAVMLTADHGPADDPSSLKAYFNRGILATQALTHEVPISKKTGAPDAGALLKRIAAPQDALRKSLSSDLTTTLPALFVEANREGGNCYAALYELHDKELESHLTGNKRLHLILSNTFDSKSGDPDKENKPARAALQPVRCGCPGPHPSRRQPHRTQQVRALHGRPGQARCCTDRLNQLDIHWPLRPDQQQPDCPVAHCCASLFRLLGQTKAGHGRGKWRRARPAGKNIPY